MPMSKSQNMPCDVDFVGTVEAWRFDEEISGISGTVERLDRDLSFFRRHPSGWPVKPIVFVTAKILELIKFFGISLLTLPPWLIFIVQSERATCV